jgi:hypothetical protein
MAGAINPARAAIAAHAYPDVSPISHAPNGRDNPGACGLQQESWDDRV